MALTIAAHCKSYDVCSKKFKEAKSNDEARSAHSALVEARAAIDKEVERAMSAADQAPDVCGIGEDLLLNSNIVTREILMAVRTLCYFNAWLACRGGWS